MPLDGALLNCLRKELSRAVDCHIDKIHIPSKNEFVLGLRGKGFSKKLYISISPDSPRIGFTDQSFDNPPSPPMFCMLLRKHLSSGRITSVEGVGSERIVIFNILSRNEMGDNVNYKLIAELMGHKTNLILVNCDGRVLDSARRSDIETAERLIIPGAVYTLPPSDGRTDFLNGDLFSASKSLCGKESPLADLIIKNISGISPLICREIALEAAGNFDASAYSVTPEKLLSVLEKFKKAADFGEPHMLTDQKGAPKDYSFVNIKQYGDMYSSKRFGTFSELLETFYKEKEHKRRLGAYQNDLLRLIKNLIVRNEKKLSLRKKELEKSKNSENLRIFGELIKANIYCIEKGAPSVTVSNYYDPEFKEVKIPLNTALSPAANAAKYFKEYKKACNAGQTLGALIKECEAEGEYLQSVLFSLQSAESIAELREIRAELLQNGYLGKVKNNGRTQKSVSKPLVFTKNGFKIMVGKNNLQNDTLTLKTASKSDIWFHTKNIHGSHVILFTDGKTPDEETVYFASCLAAKYSKASLSNQVPVDYTPVKFVKKPAGAKPGMVIYSTNQTIFADPKEVSSAESEAQ